MAEKLKSVEQARGSWRRLPQSPLNPSGHLSSVAAWTGTEILVVESGNWGNEPIMFGAAFNPSSEEWRSIEAAPLEWRDRPSAVWTGSELIVFGGANHRGPLNDGAAYDPDSDSWRLLPTPRIDGRSRHTAIWTGMEMIVSGGCCRSGGHGMFNDGAAYSPESDSWRAIRPMPLEGRHSHSAIWTGSEMVVWGGLGEVRLLNSGARYDPATDVWLRLAESPLEGREAHSAIWTGAEMVVWGGSPRVEDSPQFANGAAYAPDQDRWRLVSQSPLEGRHRHTAAWSGEEMLVWGGMREIFAGGAMRGFLSDGASYDLGTDSWAELPQSPLGARFSAPGVWTGDRLVVFGGCCHDTANAANFGDGAEYVP